MNFLKAFVKFVPVFVLAGLMISGQDALIAAAIAAITAPPPIAANMTAMLSLPLHLFDFFPFFMERP